MQVSLWIDQDPRGNILDPDKVQYLATSVLLLEQSDKMMRPTQSLFSKALRIPLNSKKANKDYYKGTRTGNILKMKRIAYIDGQGNPQLDSSGRVKTWTKRIRNGNGVQIDESRLDSYVVPPGLADTPLKPYIFTNPGDPDKVHKNSLPRAVSGYATGDNLSIQDLKFEPRIGMDAKTYRELRQRILSRRDVNEELTKDYRATSDSK
ncbi:unnamed protein product [Sympodiomycopsis kandeliae]